MKKIICLFLIALSINLANAQSFEGWITYKVEAVNPNPAMLADSIWKTILEQQFGERGYMLQKYFYKQHNYMSEIDAGKEKGFMAFNPKDKFLYSWEQNSDEAVSYDSRKNMDEIVEMVEFEKTENVLGIECNVLLIKSKLGEMTLWYNKDHLKMDPALFNGHAYGNWEAILNKIGCLPLKMEQKSSMVHIIQTAVEFKAAKVDDDKFIIPAFKNLINNPF